MILWSALLKTFGSSPDETAYARTCVLRANVESALGGLRRGVCGD